MEDKTEIIFIDSKSGKVKKLSFSKKSWKITKFFIMMFFFLSISSLFLGYATYTQYDKLIKLSQKNIVLSNKLNQKNTAIYTLEQKFVHFQQFVENIKKIVSWDFTPKETLAKGGDNNYDIKNFNSINMDKLDNVLGDFSLHSTELETELQVMFDQFNTKLSYLTSIPSIWPVKGWITSKFGYRISPFTHTLKFHEGLDIANQVGTKIVAPAEGYVIFSGWARGYGNTIIIGHGYGFSTVYGHLETINVNEGQHVERGQVIALLGSTGRSTGPHLHYEVRVKGVPVNPINYILNQ